MDASANEALLINSDTIVLSWRKTSEPPVEVNCLLSGFCSAVQQTFWQAAMLDAEASSQKARSPLSVKRGTGSVGENIAALLKVGVEGKHGGDNSEIHEDSKHDIQTCSRIRVYPESSIENGYD